MRDQSRRSPEYRTSIQFPLATSLRLPTTRVRDYIWFRVKFHQNASGTIRRCVLTLRTISCLGQTMPACNEHKLLYIQTSFSFLIGQHTPVNSQCEAVVASFPSNTVTSLPQSARKLQNFAKFFESFYYHTLLASQYDYFECIIKQFLDSAYAWYQELSRPRSMLSVSAFCFGR